MGCKKVVWIWIIFYVIFSLYLYLFFSIKIFDDFAVYTAILLYIVFFVKEIRMPVVSVWLFGIGTLPHIIGMIPFSVNNELISLYHSSIFSGNYDIMTHFIGFIFFTIGFLYFYHHNQKSISKLTLFVLFFSLIGMGTSLEILEYLGYRLFGFGWGFLAFGQGDSDLIFGPWGDSITDSISNIVGIAVGFLIYYKWVYQKKKLGKKN